MNQAWIDFLQSQGAQVQANGHMEFSNDPQALAAMDEGQTLLCALSSYTLVYVSGEDAADFLQGQVSNDIQLLQQGVNQLNSYNNPKGRMLASFRISAYGEGFLLRLPREIAERTIKRLRMFVLRSKVTLEEVTDQFVHLALIGDDALDNLISNGLPAPSQPHQSLGDDQAVVWNTPAGMEIFLTPEQARHLWQNTLAVRCGESPWQLFQVRSGQPEVVENTLESFVAQMLNFDLLDGVSFTKGCYTGQEIVARTHYLGKQKRRMYHLLCKDATPPAPGTKIFEHGSDDAQAVGEVVRAASNAQADTELLAVVQIKRMQADADLRLAASDGAPLQAGTLPYEVSTES